MKPLLLSFLIFGAVLFGQATPGFIPGGASVGSSIASASTIAPISAITPVSGTAAIQTITPPTQYTSTGLGGCLVLVATGAWSTNSSGNISTAITASSGTSYQFCYSSATSTWYPSPVGGGGGGYAPTEQFFPAAYFNATSYTQGGTAGEWVLNPALLSTSGPRGSCTNTAAGTNMECAALLAHGSRNYAIIQDRLPSGWTSGVSVTLYVSIEINVGSSGYGTVPIYASVVCGVPLTTDLRSLSFSSSPQVVYLTSPGVGNWHTFATGSISGLTMPGTCAGGEPYWVQLFRDSTANNSVVSTAGTAVLWGSGAVFNTNWAANQYVVINGSQYQIASVTSSTALVLTGSAGIQTSVGFSPDGAVDNAWLTWVAVSR